MFIIILYMDLYNGFPSCNMSTQQLSRNCCQLESECELTKKPNKAVNYKQFIETKFSICGRYVGGKSLFTIRGKAFSCIRIEAVTHLI